MPKHTSVILFCLSICFKFFFVVANAQTISTFAGSPTGKSGFSGDGGPAVNALFNGVNYIALDSEGNLYLSDHLNHRIRKITKATNIITTIAGGDKEGDVTDGADASKSLVSFPQGIVVDKSGNIFFGGIADHGRLYEITKADNKIHTVTGMAQTGNPVSGVQVKDAVIPDIAGIALDSKGNIYLAGGNSNIVWKIDLKNDLATIIAGDGSPDLWGDGGSAVQAKLNNPNDIAIDKDDNIFIADTYNARVRRIDAKTGIITTYAGGASTPAINIGLPATQTYLSAFGVTTDKSGNIYIGGDEGFVGRVDADTKIFTRVAGHIRQWGNGGDGGPAINAYMWEPTGMAIDATGQLYIADRIASNIRSLALGTLPVTLQWFTATKANKGGLLNWQTATEVNSDYFMVERSNGDENFTTISKVYAKGNSTQKQDYNFTDNTPFNGINYYRLKQVDKDGKYAYSVTRVINFLKDIGISVYPNPAKDVLVVHGLPATGNTQIAIFSLAGSKIATGIAAGENYTVNIKNLAAGTYYVKVESGRKVTTIKFIK